MTDAEKQMLDMLKTIGADLARIGELVREIRLEAGCMRDMLEAHALRLARLDLVD